MKIIQKEEILQDMLPFITNKSTEHIDNETCGISLTKHTVIGHGNKIKNDKNINYKRIEAQKEERIEAPLLSGGALVLEPQTLGICAFFDSEKAALIGMEYIREKIIKFLRLYNINGIITPRNDIIINEKKLGGFTKSPKLINNNYIIVGFINNTVKNKEIRLINNTYSSGRMGIGLKEFGLNTKMLFDFLLQELK